MKFSKTPQIIFFDIDGTLVSFKTHSFPASAKLAINRLREKGIKVIIASGRVFYDINNLEDIEFDGYITSNGTCCVDAKGEIIEKNLLSGESLCKLSLYLEKNPIPCTFTTNIGNFINFVNDRVRSMYKLVNLNVPSIIPVSEVIKYDVYQLSLFVDLEQEYEILNVLTDCTGNRWHHSFVDINAKNINKATGMDWFMKHYKIKLEHTMAFGDGGNDISMLKHAAIGVAMNNAGDEVKEAADYVTDSVDEDGIMNALKHFNIL